MNYIIGKIKQLIEYDAPLSKEVYQVTIHQAEEKYKRLERRYLKGITLLKQVINIVRIKGDETTAKEIEEYIKQNEKDN